MLLIIVNPACGDKGAPAFVHAHVIPLLTERNIHFATVQTESPGHAGHLTRQFLADSAITTPKAILIASGDGTVHEVLNDILLGDPISSDVPLVLVPCGTANALYSSCYPQPSDSIEGKLRALRSYLDGAAKRPLIVTRTDLFTAQAGSDPVRTIYSAVVTSTSLHAAILHDSEALRESVPGLERFKMAAQQNISRLYQATVHLLPTPTSTSEDAETIQAYDPTKSAFIPSSRTTVEGPFSYFLSTVNVDRLEPAFRITPLSTAQPPSAASMEIIVLRPQRSPDATLSESRTTELNMRVLTAAYKDGAHVDLVYDSSGGSLKAYGEHSTSVDDSAAAIPAVEYFRCGGWEWIPVCTFSEILVNPFADFSQSQAHGDDRARLVCADGAIVTIPPGGRARCEVLKTPNPQFEIYA
jgi:diacylglycerol kinase family enzyme